MANNNDLNKLATNLNKLLEKNFTKGLNTIGDILIKEAHQNIFNLVYSPYNPSIYNRTYNLLNGVRKNLEKKSGKAISLDVYIDDSEVMGHLYNDTSEPLEPYAEKVEKGDYDFDYPYDYNKPRPFMETTFNNTEKVIVDMVGDLIAQTLKSL